MRSRIVGRTYHINALFDGGALTVELAFQMVDSPPLTLRERQLIAAAVHFSTTAQVVLLPEDDLKFQVGGVRSLSEAITLARTVASHADTRLREDGWDLCSTLYDSRMGIVGIDD